MISVGIRTNLEFTFLLNRFRGRSQLVVSASTEMGFLLIPSLRIEITGPRALSWLGSMAK